MKSEGKWVKRRYQRKEATHLPGWLHPILNTPGVGVIVVRLHPSAARSVTRRRARVDVAAAQAGLCRLNHLCEEKTDRTMWTNSARRVVPPIASLSPP
jgi:hypothetical protein